MVRLQKFLADAGVASRRSSEELIVSGRVTVNGHVVQKLGSKVDPAADQVLVDGGPVKARRKQYVALHKPPGFLCSRNDPQGGRLIADLLPPEWGHLYSVGRLDRESEGLLLLTNDGQFSLHVTHPRYGVRKKYRVTVSGRLGSTHLEQMVRGVQDQGEQLRAERASLVRASNKQSTAELELMEGKHREIRRLCAALGLEVLRLQRIQIGRIKLGELPPGKWRTLTESEIKSLLGPL